MELTGRVTGDALVTALPDERRVVDFSIAINDYYKPKGAAEATERTLHVACSYWKGTAVATTITKGTIVEVSGRMFIRAFMGKDGNPKAALHLHCNSIKLHGKCTAKEQAGNSNKADTSLLIKEDALQDAINDIPC